MSVLDANMLENIDTRNRHGKTDAGRTILLSVLNWRHNVLVESGSL